ncbi:GSCOCG00012418001-RA-CDS, partial [Cotesia congregata]
NSDLQKCALQAKKSIEFDDFRFQTSKKWLLNFKKAHRIVSRKMNKFVTSKTIEDKKILMEKSKEFVESVKKKIAIYGLPNTFNSDQSGFQLEMHSGRTLAVEGDKQVQCLVQSVSYTTHSYTIQPTISADGKLLSPLFLVLKEPSGKFGPVVEITLFKTDNVYVVPSKSGKLTSSN